MNHGENGKAPSTWVLNTLDTSITISILNNRPTINEIRNPTRNYNWTPTAAVLALPTRVAVSGGADHTSATWTYHGAVVDEGNGKKVTLLFLCDQVPGVSVESVWSASSPYLPGPVQHNFRIVNGTANSISTFPQLEGLDITVVPDIGEVDVWRFNKDRCPVDDIGVYRESLLPGSCHTASVFDESLGGGFIPISVIDSGSKHGLYVGWEWQVGRVNVTADPSNPITANIKAGYANGGDVPIDRLVIEADTTFNIPSVYLGAYLGDLDDGTNRFKRWFWNNKVPANMRNDPTEPWTQFGGMFYHWDSPADRIVWASNQATYTQGMEERLSNIGFESVEVDNGWWGPGEQENPPSGAVHQFPFSFEASSALWPKGMAIAGASAHRNGFRFNLYFTNAVHWDNKEVLKQKYLEYEMDCWRNDFIRPDIAMLDWLAANVPNYRYETCNGGGDNKDYATYIRASVGTITDDVYPLSLRKAFYDSSFALPPAQLSQCHQIGYLEARVLATPTQFPYCLRSGMLGAMFPAICAVGPYYNPSNVVLPSDDGNQWTIPIYTSNVEIYKASLRPLIRDADVYHILPRPDGTNWDGIEYYDPQIKKGALMLFKPGSQPDDKTLFFKGLERSRMYALTFTDRPEQNGSRSGAELMDNGLVVTMTGTLTSEIVLFKDCERPQ